MARGIGVARLVPLALLVLVACDPHTTVSAGPLQVSPARIEFERTHIGHPVRARISVANTGLAPLRAKLAVEPPWLVPPELELAPGERAELDIEFAPQGAGEHWADLQVHTIEGSVSVELRGSALPIPGCSGACRADR